ncbi:flavin-dependent oxidoreductase [Ferrovibrio terrae]|uniref:Flavin-dependent oxidoreductase n=1 Tax=Ferrovibrio terrae TaxID=2594003 RepID=A0A516H4E0_9PROT|nr:flavin-dependent oxidoreductase [Ferrovibrio terrae]QDO98601.1 flavin-dependent oxidoreductase [Ferrovibrio terrae]
MEVLIVGGGIGGLTLALALHERGIACRIFEMAPQIRAIGVGINLLPHSTKELGRLGLEAELAKAAVTTKDAAFFNRFGQLIHREPLGRAAGYDWPQFSIHRGDLQMILLAAVEQRIGKDRIHAGWQCTGFSQDAGKAIAQFRNSETGEALPDQQADVIIACDGIHSAIRKQMHRSEGEPRYSGVNMWRGVTRMKSILSGACMVRAGWLSHGKMVIYPIRENVDAEGNQLMNWVAEIETQTYRKRDWSRPGSLDDFLPAFADWHFDWLDVPDMIRKADTVLEFPMVDQEPLDHWTEGRVTLLGDAAHPMVPRGSNGAGQAILDCRLLADLLAENADPREALAAYEAKRLPATTQVVLTNRTNPPDAILREVYERTGDKPFTRIEDVISPAELTAITDSYKRVAGYDRDKLKAAG